MFPALINGTISTRKPGVTIDCPSQPHSIQCRSVLLPLWTFDSLPSFLLPTVAGLIQALMTFYLKCCPTSSLPSLQLLIYSAHCSQWYFLNRNQTMLLCSYKAAMAPHCQENSVLNLKAWLFSFLWADTPSALSLAKCHCFHTNPAIPPDQVLKTSQAHPGPHTFVLLFEKFPRLHCSVLSLPLRFILPDINVSSLWRFCLSTTSSVQFS